MLTDLIKLSTYLGNSKLGVELNSLIKTASNFDQNVAVLNDRLIELDLNDYLLPETPKGTDFYSHKQIRFLHRLIDVYQNISSQDALLESLCIAVYNSITDHNIIASAIPSTVETGDVMRIFRALVKILIEKYLSSDINQVSNNEYRQFVSDTLMKGLTNLEKIHAPYDLNIIFEPIINRAHFDMNFEHSIFTSNFWNYIMDDWSIGFDEDFVLSFFVADFRYNEYAEEIGDRAEFLRKFLTLDDFM